MGAIQRQSSPRSVEHLYQSHTIGRAQSCELVLAIRAISGHHATIRWVEGAWTLRDLRSRNGTFLNGRRIVGESHPLEVGDRLTFAESDEIWELIDGGEPRSLLIPLDSDAPPIELDHHDVLALPSAEEPRWTIYHRQDGWQIERGGECSALEDRQELKLGDRHFRLMLMSHLLPATDATSTPVQRRVEELRLEIYVSRDEESAAVRVRLGTERHELPERTFFYLLAFLARRRLEQAESKEPKAGWIDVQTVCRELSLASPEALGLIVHRCRKAVKTCQVENPADIIDRSRKGRLRIGVEAEQLLVARMS